MPNPYLLCFQLRLLNQNGAKTLDKQLKANQELWDEWTLMHEDSKEYDVDGFLRGKQTLNPIEIRELGSVKGKSLLHLQCHFGLDTMSWARLGAEVTGMDFSEKAITLAQKLSKQTGIKAEFIQSDVYDLPKVLEKEYDIVFTSEGVLVWLPDLEKWAHVISKFLKRGGKFYIREGHPFFKIFDDEITTRELKIRYPYSTPENPFHFRDSETYTESTRKIEPMDWYEWNHSVSEIINSLIKAGLRIDFFNEYTYIGAKVLPFLVQREDGNWTLPADMGEMPLQFSLMATKF